MVNTEIRLIIFFAAKYREALSIQLAKTRLGADCGSGHKLLIAKFKSKLKKGGKITRPFNPLQSYSGSDKQLQRLDLIDRVTEELWTEVTDTVENAMIKTILKKKKCKKSKWLSEEALQIAVKRREAKSNEKRKDIPT